MFTDRNEAIFHRFFRTDANLVVKRLLLKAIALPCLQPRLFAKCYLGKL